jgi:hypothetical protein
MPRALKVWGLINFVAIAVCLYCGSVDWHDDSCLLARDYLGTLFWMGALAILVVPAHIIAIGFAIVQLFRAGRLTWLAASACSALLWFSGWMYQSYRANRETPEARAIDLEEAKFDEYQRSQQELNRQYPHPAEFQMRNSFEKLKEEFKAAVQESKVSPSPTEQP